MAPDRGNMPAPGAEYHANWHGLPDGRSFTARGIAIGLAVGLVICFSNMYFGLQTGWVSTMTMPASLMGFGIFRAARKHLQFPFSPVENVLVQTVAGSMAIMPLGCGFVGVIPAMNYLLTPEEQGPLFISSWKLIIWSLGLCYFGVVFAVPLRRQVIVRERLRFPSGFSTAILISVLHGHSPDSKSSRLSSLPEAGDFASLAPIPGEWSPPQPYDGSGTDATDAPGRLDRGPGTSKSEDWARGTKLLALSFATSGLFTLVTYFLPFLRNLPIFGTTAAATWLWTLNPSLAYVGQGIIMGPETTLHMLVGAVVGWAILSPLAHFRAWAPGPVDDWENGSKGWIVWISLAIMLTDALVSLGYLSLRSILPPAVAPQLMKWAAQGLPGLGAIGRRFLQPSRSGYRTFATTDDEAPASASAAAEASTSPALAPVSEQGPDQLEDAPEYQQISWQVLWIGFILSVLLCVVTTRVVFGKHIPLHATIIAVFMALVLSVMGVRALGETDLNPVSGISKLAQLFFAVVIPQTNPSSIVVNLVAGAVSEAGALQAGDLMQDLKTGHLLGAAPKAQFWGQVIGATCGAIVSAWIYRLYTTVYTIPGELFQVPTSYVWIFTARLVTGKGLPPMAREWATWAGILFAVTTLARALSVGKPWRKYIPGGIAVAIGMYNVPSFTLARFIGGIVAWYWRKSTNWSETSLIIVASGMVLGEGFMSVANLLLQSFDVPHW